MRKKFIVAEKEKEKRIDAIRSSKKYDVILWLSRRN